MKQRLGVRLGIAVLLLFVMGQSAMAATTVNVWFGEWTDQYIAAFQELIDAFAAENEDVDVQVEQLGHPDSWGDRFLTSVIGGNPPDVAYIHTWKFHEYLAQDILTPLNGYFAALGGDAVQAVAPEAWMGDTFQSFGHKGTLYGVPFRTAIWGLFADADRFAESGMDPAVGPQSIAELDEAARRLTRRSPNGEIAQYGFRPWNNNFHELFWALAFGGEFYDWQNHRLSVLNNAGLRDALNWILTYADNYGTQRAGSGEREFETGTLALLANSTTYLTTLADRAPHVNYTTHPLPHAANGRNPTYTAILGPVVPKGAANPEAGARLLAFLARPETQLTWWRNTQSLPVRMDALREVVAEMDDPKERNLVVRFPAANPDFPMRLQAAGHPEFGYRTWLTKLINREATVDEYIVNVDKLNTVLYDPILGELRK